MISWSHKALIHQINHLAAHGEEYLLAERAPVGSPNLYYNRRPLTKIDQEILVAVHDHIEDCAGEGWENYRKTLNL